MLIRSLGPSRLLTFNIANKVHTILNVKADEINKTAHLTQFTRTILTYWQRKTVAVMSYALFHGSPNSNWLHFGGKLGVCSLTLDTHIEVLDILLKR